MKIVNCIGLTALAAISFGGDHSGYLARIGPAPLRYQPPPHGPEVTVNLPPLAMSDPPAPAHEVTATTNEIVTVEPPQQAAVVSSPQPAVVVEPGFTPQMLLQYFNRTGTNAEPAVVVPYQFTPPSAPVIPAPPSKANYTKK